MNDEDYRKYEIKNIQLSSIMSVVSIMYVPFTVLCMEMGQ